MEDHLGRRHRNEDRDTMIVLGAIGALLFAAIAGVLFVSLNPYSNGDAKQDAYTETPASVQVPVTPVAAEPVVVPDTPAQVTTAPAAAVAPVAPVSTLPDQMASIPTSSRQIIVITGAKLGSNTGTLAVYNLDDGHWTEMMKTPANFGQKGLVDGKTRTSGHLQTPTGIWTIGPFVFGQHSSAPAGTKMPYRAITTNSYWSSQRDATYNSWVESKSHVTGEHLSEIKVPYKYAFNTGYNSLPNERVFGRGTAIFIHCFEPPGNSLGKFTHGCIAVDRQEMVKMYGILDPVRNPTCAIGTLAKGPPTAIWTY